MMRIIGGKLKGRKLVTPAGEKTRPTTDRTRESLFNILANRIDFPGIAVLDLFAGTGALGIEAISRGAARVTFVENASPALSALRTNIDTCGIAAEASIVKADAGKLSSIGNSEPYDLVFADPPYSKALGERAAKQVVMGGWLSSNALLVLEEGQGYAPGSLPSFALLDQRRYGNTSIGIFRFLG